MNIKSLLEQGYIVVCDTNVFLNVYRYSPHFSEFVLSCLELIKDSIVIPSTVKIEFKKNQKTWFVNAKKNIHAKYDSLGEQITDARARILKTCDELESFQLPDILDLKQELSDKLEEIEDTTKEFFENRPVLDLVSNFWGDKDPVLKFFHTLVDNGQSMVAPTQEDIYGFCEEGEKRYKRKDPPGFKDAKNKDGVKKYSDLILWKEILSYAKRNKKNVIFITDDVKCDWWQKDDGVKKFHSKLMEEFHKKTKMEIMPFTSLEFYKELSDNYGIDRPDIVEIALKMTDNDYFERVKESVFDSILTDLMFSGGKYLDEDWNDFQDVDELEITGYEFSSASQLCRDNDTITYEFVYRVEAESDAYEWLGRDEDTREFIRGNVGILKFNGEIRVEVIRKADIYLDFEGDSGFEEATITEGNLELTEFIPILEDDHEEYLPGAYTTCPNCGCPINHENDGGNGFCIDCAPNH